MTSIRSVFWILSSLMSLLLLLLAAVVFQLNGAIDQTKLLSEQRQLQLILADRLRSHTDALSDLARAYVTTGNGRWKASYEHLINSPEQGMFGARVWEELSARQLKAVEASSSSLIAGLDNNQQMHLDTIMQQAGRIHHTEQQAMARFDGHLEDSSGQLQGRPDPQGAIDQLYGANYLQERAQFFDGFHNFFDEVDQQSRLAMADALRHEDGLSRSLSALLALLFITTVCILMLLWRWYLKPVDWMQKNLTVQVLKGDYQVQMEQSRAGALHSLAEAQSALLNEVRELLQANETTKALIDVLREAREVSDFGDRLVNFFAQELNLPMVALYKSSSGGLERIAGFGYLKNNDFRIQEQNAIQMCIAKGQKHHVLKNLGGRYHLSVVEGQITLEELHFFPLRVNDILVGFLEFGCHTPLDEQQLEWMLEIKRDLAVSFQLVRNLEQQSQAERQITEQLEFIRQVLDAIPSPMYYQDSTGRYLGVNNAFMDFVGAFEMDIIGNNNKGLFDEVAEGIFNDARQNLMSRPGKTQYDLQLSNADGELRHINIVEATYFSAKGEPKGIVGLFMDVTEQKVLENQLRTAKDAADDASRAKGEFLANMSHEIRTPMNAIIGMAHLALHSGLDDTQQHYVSKIDSAARALLGIINDILDFSKVESGKMTIEHIDFQLDEVLDNLSNVISFKAEEKGLELLFDMDHALPMALVGDPLRLSQILINLCGNAVKFTEKGEIIVRVRFERVEEPAGSVMLRIQVQDTGIGMTKDQMNRLFQSFSQADSSITRKYGGTGLGLTISKKLVELMGGRMEVSSVPGEGSVFSFNVLVGTQDSKALEYYQPDISLHGKRVLVVDDNDAAREIMLGLLKAMSFRVMAVSNGFEAVAAVRQSAIEEDPFEIVFMDWMMPGMDGMETIKKMEQDLMGIQAKTIMVTAYGREVQVSPQVEHLVHGLVIKPVNPSLLFDAIANAFGKSADFLPAKTQPQKTDLYQEEGLKGVRVLLVEDNETNREVAKGMLAPFGVQITEAINGLVALEALDNEQIDLVLMDMQMPVMDGLTATRKIRDNPKFDALPIVAMTANAMQEDVENCKAAGMNDHVGKPIMLAELVQKMKACLAMDASVRPAQQALPAAADAPEFEPEDAVELNVAQSADPQVLDMKKGIERLGGNEQLYWQIVGTFVLSREKEMALLEAAFADANLPQLGDIGHTIKGAASNIAATNLSELGRSLEQDAKAGTMPSAELLAQIKTAVAELAAVFTQYGSAEPVADDQPKTVRSYDSREFVMELEQLGMLLDNFDTQALDFVAPLKENAANLRGVSISFATLEAALQSFDFETARNSLDEMIALVKAS